MSLVKLSEYSKIVAAELLQPRCSECFEDGVAKPLNFICDVTRFGNEERQLWLCNSCNNLYVGDNREHDHKLNGYSIQRAAKNQTDIADTYNRLSNYISTNYDTRLVNSLAHKMVYGANEVATKFMHCEMNDTTLKLRLDKFLEERGKDSNAPLRDRVLQFSF